MSKKIIVSFDEENLNKNEKHFIENPPMIQITEPKTPFHKDNTNINSIWDKDTDEDEDENKDEDKDKDSYENGEKNFVESKNKKN
jgi:hypothetical protein